MIDPTYVRAEIDQNPIWKLAFIMSELDNDNAPIGWAKYINLAQGLISMYEMRLRDVSKNDSHS